MNVGTKLSDPTVLVALVDAAVFFLLLCMAILKLRKLKYFDSNAKYSKLFYIYQCVFLILRTATFSLIPFIQSLCETTNQNQQEISNKWHNIIIQSMQNFPDMLYLLQMLILLWITASSHYHC